MRITKHVLSLSNGRLYILDPMSLEICRKFDTDATTFATNHNGWIATACGKKIFFYTFRVEAQDFAPLTLGKSCEAVVPDAVFRLGMASGHIVYHNSLER